MTVNFKGIFAKPKKRVLIGEICSFGFFLALMVITRAIFKYIDIINGYSLQIQMLTYSLAIFLLQTFWFRISFCLFAPFLLLVFGISGNIFFDYILTYWGFAGFVFLPIIIKCFHTKKSATFSLIVFALIFNIFGHCIMLISYIISGVLFFKVDANSAFIFNGPIVGISAAINIPLTAICIYPLSLLRTRINNKIYY